jgi:polysaccharide pyruvyl transferase WcaK-like protein
MEGKYDVPASNDVLSHMKHADKTFMLGSDFSPNQFLNFIRHADLTVGLRLHALIFSALSNVPHLGFSYDKKVESFLIRSGMWDYSFRLGEIDESKLLENALYLLDHKELAQQSMKPNVDQLRREAMRNLDLLKEKFGN